MSKEMTKEQLIELLKARELEVEQLKSQSGETMPQRVFKLIEAGHRTIEELATELKTNNRNISSNLTYIRRELKQKGKWLVSAKIDDKTFLKVVDLQEFGWI